MGVGCLLSYFPFAEFAAVPTNAFLAWFVGLCFDFQMRLGSLDPLLFIVRHRV